MLFGFSISKNNDLSHFVLLYVSILCLPNEFYFIAIMYEILKLFNRIRFISIFCLAIICMILRHPYIELHFMAKSVELPAALVN